MNSRRASPSRRSGDPRLDDALAYLLASTRRVKRGTDLLKVPGQLAVARASLGSLKAVSELVGVSEEMLREFASIENLSNAVKAMIKSGKLTSVDVAYRIGMLPLAEQKIAAAEYISGELSGNDIKSVVSFRKRNPHITVTEAIRKVKATRDIDRYLIRLPVPQGSNALAGLRRKFERLVGSRNVLSIHQSAKVVTVAITRRGEQHLRDEARMHGLAKKDFVRMITEG